MSIADAAPRSRTIGDVSASEPTRPVAPALRAVFIIGGALLFLAGTILFVQPSRTDRFFAWTIQPPLQAVFLGALFWTAALVAASSARQHAWARARLGVPGVTVFTVLTLAATLLHLDRFHLEDPDLLPRTAAWVWLVVYAVQPIALVAAIVLQRRVAGGDPDRTNPIPRWLRTLAVAQTGILLSYGVGLFAVPDTVSRWWPWTLTPLTARATAAWLVAVGVMVAQGAWEGDHDRVRVAGPAYVLLAILQLGAIARFPDELPWAQAGPWLYVAFLATLVVVGMASWAGGTRARA